MKAFVKYVTFFIAPILIFIIVGELLLRNIPNDYSYKSKYLDKNAQKIETLFLGSSHFYFGINPEFIESKSFNAAHISQSLDFDLKILEKYNNHWDSLKYIVVPVDYFSLYLKLETGIEAWRVKNYSLYYGIRSDYKVENNTEIFSSMFKANYGRFKQYYFKGKNDITCSALGWGLNYNSKNNKDLKISGKTAAKRHTAKNKDYFNENVAVLNQIIEFAENKNCTIIFVTTPAHIAYVSNLNANQLNSTSNVIRNLSKLNKNVIYINMLTDSSFVKEDYFDADHLNEIGAKKFTLKLETIIESLETK